MLTLILSTYHVKVLAGSTILLWDIRFGEHYRPGIYFVRIMQGKEHKEIKLI